MGRDGIIGLYRGFLPNALKTLPNSRFTFLHLFTCFSISIIGLLVAVVNFGGGDIRRIMVAYYLKLVLISLVVKNF